MLFNSFDFLIFFVFFYASFFSTKGTLRHLVLFAASSIFYAWFVPKYLFILFGLILLDFAAAIFIERDAWSKKSLVLAVAIINTCAILFLFKYHNFFVENINSFAGTAFSPWSLILPIGLSFHTFQSLSYVIDVYRKKIHAERNLLVYANYVMMFPQLVAGPIERGAHLLPQLRLPFNHILTERDFTAGLTLFFFGLFKKLVIADSIGIYVDAVYANYTHHNSATLLLASALFAIQIYADFSGYSDMAIGIARSIGISFRPNFKTPFFARSVTEFWRRWHISLSSWLRDYLFYPLTFALGRATKWKVMLSTLVTFALIGLWHGANWTYVIFGVLHGLYLVGEMITKTVRDTLERYAVKTHSAFAWHLMETLFTFYLVSMSYIFFRSPNLSQAMEIFKKTTTAWAGTMPNLLDLTAFGTIVFAVALLFMVECFCLNKHSIESLLASEKVKKYQPLLITIAIALILAFGQVGGKTFIYFQF